VEEIYGTLHSHRRSNPREGQQKGGVSLTVPCRSWVGFHDIEPGDLVVEPREQVAAVGLKQVPVMLTAVVILE